LLEKNKKGQDRDAAHRHHKTDVAEVKRFVAEEQRPISQEGRENSANFASSEAARRQATVLEGIASIP